MTVVIVIIRNHLITGVIFTLVNLVGFVYIQNSLKWIAPGWGWEPQTGQSRYFRGNYVLTTLLFDETLESSEKQTNSRNCYVCLNAKHFSSLFILPLQNISHISTKRANMSDFILQQGLTKLFKDISKLRLRCS